MSETRTTSTRRNPIQSVFPLPHTLYWRRCRAVVSFCLCFSDSKVSRSQRLRHFLVVPGPTADETKIDCESTDVLEYGGMACLPVQSWRMSSEIRSLCWDRDTVASRDAFNTQVKYRWLRGGYSAHCRQFFRPGYLWDMPSNQAPPTRRQIDKPNIGLPCPGPR